MHIRELIEREGIMEKKKLIEVALPLEAINAASAREKSIRHGHPSTLHLWWARRPLAAARAVIWASLVDDPSSHPEEFPTEEDQAKERERLFGILEELVVWENSNNQDVLNRAKKEIEKSTGGNIPALLDPFAGGGAIPLEAQRLGLEAHAHDLNPVAVVINKAMIEIPPIFVNKSPINPDDRVNRAEGTWCGTDGLASDVRYYGDCIKKEAYKRLKGLYPRVKVPKEFGGGNANVIAWIWVRTVKCPNPACGCEMPLARSFILSNKKNSIAWIKPYYNDNKTKFKVIHHDKPSISGTVNRRGAICYFCNTPVEFPYIRNEGQAGRMNELLAAVVAEGESGRIYIDPDEEQEKASNISRPIYYPDGELPNNPRDFKTPNYGKCSFAELFTNRQLTALITFSEVLKEFQDIIFQDALKAGLVDDKKRLEQGGSGALAYSQALCVYLAIGIDRMADINNAFCGWKPSATQVIHVFTRQAIAMVWDFAENNVFNNAAGDYTVGLNSVVKVIKNLHSTKKGSVMQFDAQTDCGLRNIIVSTDPPYYDNISYADLSDFFYIWMRENLKEVYPSLFETMMVPKQEELIASPYRFEDDSGKAKVFFERGMLNTCKEIYKYSRGEIPVTIYYAYKQSDTEESDKDSLVQTASTGWETMLNAVILAGFSITGTWPIRTEMATRSIAAGTNALASSVVLVCKKRPKNAGKTTRRSLVNELRRSIKPALEKLQASNIAPVDLAQSAIGPGMAVFSKYEEVLEADGSPMSVRSALQIINQELDIFFNEQDGELDRESRFCVELYTQSAFNDIKFGDADTLARAKNTSVAALSAKGVLYAQKGVVHLLSRDEITKKLSMSVNMDWLLTQHLTRAMETGGIEACAKIIAPIMGSDAERAKALAYRLYTIAERKGWAQEAFAYNSLVIAWQDIQSRAADMQAAIPEQLSIFDFTENEEE